VSEVRSGRNATPRTDRVTAAHMTRLHTWSSRPPRLIRNRSDSRPSGVRIETSLTRSQEPYGPLVKYCSRGALPRFRPVGAVEAADSTPAAMGVLLSPGTPLRGRMTFPIHGRRRGCQERRLHLPGSGHADCRRTDEHLPPSAPGDLGDRLRGRRLRFAPQQKRGGRGFAPLSSCRGSWACSS